jgi:hypothetical protein
MKTRVTVRSVFLAVSFVGSACDDVSALAYRPPPEDADVPDHVDVNQVARCRSCANAPGATCRAARDSCQAADSRCGQLLDCLTDTNCWRQLNLQNFTDPPPCGRECLSAANVTSINEIGGPATQFYLCVIDPARCAPACFQEAPGTARDR